MTTIITEKKSVAELMAMAVGADYRAKGWFEGNGYYVTWASGHLLEKHVPEADGEWTLNKLPIIPNEFRLVPRKGRDGRGHKVSNPSIEERLYTIKNLLMQSDKVINAGDPGMEGELIQREILSYTRCRLPVLRLWSSSNEQTALKEAMRNLRPSQEFDSLYLAAKARSEADWLVGINATMALTCSTQYNKTLSLGRVQTPTLALICRRYIENHNFKPQPFYRIELSCMNDQGETFTLSSERIDDRETAERMLNQANTLKNARISAFKEENVSERPPLLYNLTALQKEASRRFSIAIEDTDKAAQELYAVSANISYPRTPSQHITKHEYEIMPELIKGLTTYVPLANKASALVGRNLNDHAVNDVKVTDHHALIITRNIPDHEDLDDNQKAIYELIAERMLEAFSPDCTKLARHAEVTIGENIYKASASLIMEPGWRAVRGVSVNLQEEKETAQEENNPDDYQQNTMSIPHLTEGESVTVVGVALLQGITTAPPLYTESALLTAMENAGAKPGTKAQEKGIKKGLGTDATRDSILATLRNRDYVTRTGKKKVYEPTALGLTVYNIVKDKYISDAEMTARWEEALENIIDRRINVDDFNTSIRQYAAQLTNDLIMGDHKAEILSTMTHETCKCPNCGKTTFLSQKGFFCKNCDFIIWRSIAGKKLTDFQLKTLVETGATPEIQGFKRKDGTTFSASLMRSGDKVLFQKK